jgi:hypothetical protein
MTITLDIAPEVQAALARQAAAHGRPIEAYAASLLEEAAHIAAEVEKPAASSARDAAIERLKAFGKTHRLSLGGMTIRELRQEARP